jgi:Domain of unknown function (DUF4189)
MPAPARLGIGRYCIAVKGVWAARRLSLAPPHIIVIGRNNDVTQFRGEAMSKAKGLALAVAVGLALALSAAAPASAMCLNNCIVNCNTSDSTCLDICEEQYQQCQEQEQQHQRPSYGAIAYGPTSGAWGTSYQWGSKAEAERTALKKCGKPDCKAVIWFDRRCGAVAADDATGDYGYDSGASKGAAEASARRYCARQGGKSCKVVVSACSF